MDSSSSSSGLLIGGSDNGIISIYDAKKIITGDADDAPVFQSSKHTGNPQLQLSVKPVNNIGCVSHIKVNHFDSL